MRRLFALVSGAGLLGSVFHPALFPIAGPLGVDVERVQTFIAAGAPMAYAVDVAKCLRHAQEGGEAQGREGFERDHAVEGELRAVIVVRLYGSCSLDTVCFPTPPRNLYRLQNTCTLFGRSCILYCLQTTNNQKNCRYIKPHHHY